MPDHPPDAARELFEQLLELPEPEREARLQELTVDNVALEARVRRLLEAHERATGFDSVIPAPPDISLPDPEHIGPYRVLEKLGEGGMGIVYLAEQKKPVRRRVAIKIVRPGMASAEVINRFNAERQALALMSHPGISRILDAGATENGLPYFVMEYVPGVPLISYCDEHRLSLRQRVSLVRHICLAVQHAHQKGVIHRDLKPSNILVVEDDGEPLPKIIDFGIAKAMSQPLTDGTLHTRIGKLIGTPDYMSPEQCNSGSVDVDTRSDVYSLGVLLYQLLSSQLPYDFDRSKDNEVTILQRIVDEDPPPPSRRARDAATGDAANRGLGDAYSLERRIRGELDWIVGRALERDRNRRYASAQELADDLGRFLNDEAVVAGPPSIGYRAGKFIRRHALGVSLMASIFLLVAGFAAALAWQLEQTRLERDRANREANIARTVTDFTAGLFELASPSESGTSDVSARELLDLGVQYLQLESSVTSPRVRAALLQSAGTAYLGIGAFDEAQELLDEAVSIMRENDAQPDALINGLIARSRLEFKRGDFVAAIRTLQDALRHSAEHLAGNDDLKFAIDLELMNALRASGDFQGAEEILTGSVADRIDHGITDKQRAAVTLAEGNLRLAQGELDDAERLLREALHLNERLHGTMALTTSMAKTQLAEVLVVAGRPLDAKPLLQELVEERRKLYGNDHGEVGIALNNLGNALSDFPETFDEAERAYRDALKINQQAFGEEHPETAVVYNNLGTLHLFRRQWQQADAAYADAVRIRIAVLGAEHPDTAGSLVGRGLALNRLEKFESAEAILRDGVEAFSAALGESHWRTANARLYHGLVLGNMGLFSRAEQQLRQAAGDLLETLDSSHWRYLNALQALGEVLMKSGDLDAAGIELENAYKGTLEQYGDDHPRTNRVKATLEQLAELKHANDDHN